MDNGMSLSDIAAVTRDNDGFGGSNGAWWIIILLLALGGGLWGNRQMPNGEPVTEAGLCSAMNFNDLQNAVGRLSDNENLHMMQLSQGLASVGYENLRNFASTQQTVQNGDYALAQQLSECCCTTQRAIDGASTRTPRTSRRSTRTSTRSSRLLRRTSLSRPSLRSRTKSTS